MPFDFAIPSFLSLVNFKNWSSTTGKLQAILS